MTRKLVQEFKECEGVDIASLEENVSSVNGSSVEDVECVQQSFLPFDYNVSSLEITNHLHSQALCTLKVSY